KNTGLHLTSLNITCGDVVEDEVAADVAGGILGREVLAGLLQHHRELEFVVELFGEMFGVNDRLVLTADGVNVLEENNPRHNRMRESRFAGFFVVFAKISCSVKEFFRHDGSSELDF